MRLWPLVKHLLHRIHPPLCMQAEDYLDPTYISHGLTADVDSPRNSMPQLRLSPAANPTILLRRLKAAAMLAADKDTSTDSTGITNAGPEARSSFELNPAAQANNQMVSEAMMLPSLQAAEGKQSTAVAVAGSGNSNACHLGKPSTRGLVQRASFEL